MVKHYTNPAPKPRAVIGTPWWIRLAVYVAIVAARNDIAALTKAVAELTALIKEKK